MAAPVDNANTAAIRPAGTGPRVASRRPRALSALFACAILSAPLAAVAAEVTDVLDAFDDEFNNPYDLSLRVRFTHDARSAAIAREVRCIAADQVGSEVCSTGSRTVLARELLYDASRQTMNIDARIGVYKDFELMASFPIVVGYSWSHKFAPGVTRNNSTLLPPTDRDAVVAVPYKSTERAGFGDMTLGLSWSPYNYYRDPSKPTWTWALSWTLPTGEPMAANNDGVGLGLHQLKLRTVISRRALRILEPFVGMSFTGFFESQDSLFAKTRQPATQRYVTPGPIFGVLFGGEIIPWEDLKNDARVELEAGFAMDYHFRGRAYSELWEALASPDNPCAKSDSCSNVSHTKSDPDPATGRAALTNGITDVEQYGRFTGWASLHYQPVRYFQISARFSYAVETPHFITFGDYGINLDGKFGVQQANTETPPKNEFSPVYLPALDTPGSRIRVQDVSATAFMLSVSGKL
jgi:hypothetical protein